MMMKLWKRIAIEAFAVLGLVGDVLLMYNFGGRNCVLSLVLGLVLAAYCALVFMIALRSGQQPIPQSQPSGKKLNQKAGTLLSSPSAQSENHR